VLLPSSIAPQRIRPLRRSEYERLVTLGAFEDDHVELINGNLVTMAPNDPEHASPIEILTSLLVPAVGARGRVRIQLPIIAADESEPEPDVAIVPNGDYTRQHPDRAFLLIEVAASSLKKDREVKGPLYAASGFAEYWIVNVQQRCVEVFRRPEGGTYAETFTLGAGATVAPLEFPDVAVLVDAIFGGRGA
jgi:Uma2 family endonuclease